MLNVVYLLKAICYQARYNFPLNGIEIYGTLLSEKFSIEYGILNDVKKSLRGSVEFF